MDKSESVIVVVTITTAITTMIVYLKNLAGDLEAISLDPESTGETLYAYLDNNVRLFRQDRALYLDDVLQQEEVLNVFYAEIDPIYSVQIWPAEQDDDELEKLIELGELDTKEKYELIIKSGRRFLPREVIDSETTFTFYHSDDGYFYDSIDSPPFMTMEEFFMSHSRTDYLLYQDLLVRWQNVRSMEAFWEKEED